MHEAQVARMFSEINDCRVKKMPQLYHCDYRAKIDGQIFNLEIKCRDIRWGQYETIILSKHKLDDNFTDYMERDFVFLFLVKCDSGLYQFRLTELNSELLDVAEGGRTDRGDPLDIEPVYHIPIYLFDLIGQ